MLGKRRKNSEVEGNQVASGSNGEDRSGVVLVLWCVILVIKMTILQFQ